MKESVPAWTPLSSVPFYHKFPRIKLFKELFHFGRTLFRLKQLRPYSCNRHPGRRVSGDPGSISRPVHQSQRVVDGPRIGVRGDEAGARPAAARRQTVDPYRLDRALIEQTGINAVENNADEPASRGCRRGRCGASFDTRLLTQPLLRMRKGEGSFGRLRTGC